MEDREEPLKCEECEGWEDGEHKPRYFSTKNELLDHRFEELEGGNGDVKCHVRHDPIP